MSTALVVVDVQRGLFDCGHPLHRGEEVVERIGDLLDRARSAGMTIFHVQHDGGPGHILEKGSVGWPHHPRVAPAQGETIIEKRHQSAFQATDFAARLEHAGIRSLIIAGVQTEMCVDTTCRAAFALGFAVTLVSDAHTTFDSAVLPAEKIIAHHNQTLRNRFARLASASEIGF
jgi:nicotinamidase-related amidase